MIGRPANAVGDVVKSAEAPAIQDLDRHYRGVKSYAGLPPAVVCRLSNRARHMRSVLVIVVWVRIAVGKIVAGDKVGIGQVRYPPVPVSAVRIILIGDAGID